MKKIKKISNLIIRIFDLEEITGEEGLQVIFNLLLNTCAKNKVRIEDLKTLLESPLKTYPEFLNFYADKTDDPA